MSLDKHFDCSCLRLAWNNVLHHWTAHGFFYQAFSRLHCSLRDIQNTACSCIALCNLMLVRTWVPGWSYCLYFPGRCLSPCIFWGKPDQSITAHVYLQLTVSSIALWNNRLCNGHSVSNVNETCTLLNWHLATDCQLYIRCDSCSSWSNKLCSRHSNLC